MIGSYETQWLEIYNELISRGVDPDEAEVEATDILDDPEQRSEWGY